MRLLIPALALVACQAPVDPALHGSAGQELAFDANETTGILLVANNATFDELDLDAALDARAAGNIVDHRLGPDGVEATADDERFGSIEELDAVKYVGPSALAALRDYADSLGLIEPGEEMGYTAEEVEATLALANTATFEELDLDVGLDVRAAGNIVDVRAGLDGVEGTADDQPYDRLAALDAVPWVGEAAIATLVAHAMAEQAVDPVPSCLILSEVIEGSGAYNKAIEVYNCGTEAVDLSRHGACLVRNDDTTCGTARTFEAGELAPGEVYTACRSTNDAFNDPYPQLVDKCDQELTLLSFSGNDRIVLFEDLDGDGDFAESTDRVTDLLGRFGWTPDWEIWSDVNLRRCRVEPWLDTGWYDTADWFTSHNPVDFTEFGLPPVEGC